MKMDTVLDSTTWKLALPGERTLLLGSETLIMGVLNLTPDSFSDGGLWAEPAEAVAAALRMERDGADILDLGAESTRPGGGVYGQGARDVPTDEELARLLPVLETLRPLTRCPISVDTRKAEVAEAALEAGADIINDVSALGDPRTAEVLVEAGCPVVLMHSRGSLREMQHDVRYDDLMTDVRRELEERITTAERAGVSREQIIVDPGIGFAKNAAGNLAILGRLDTLRELGRPVLVGASRKSFLGKLTHREPAERLAGSLAAAAWAAAHGTEILRVHDVRETRDFLTTWRAIDRAAEGDE